MAEENDDDTIDTDIDDAADDVSPADQGAGSDADSTPEPAQATPSPQMNPVLQKYLSDKQSLLAAQQKASDNDFLTGMGRAAASLSAGLAHQNKAVDESGFNAMEKADQAPVNNLINAQRAEALELGNQKDLASAEKQSENEDPQSPQSIAKKELIKKLYPGKFNDDQLKDISAADIGDSILKPLELDEKIKEAKQNQLNRAQDRTDTLRQRAEDKAAADHDKYVQHIEDNEKSWRSDPASQRFDAQLAAAQAGKAMIDRYRGKEDQMPIQDIHALVSDRLKAITGATPTEQEIAAQMPHTLSTRWANTKSFFTGTPQPANAGEFVKNIDSSFREMEKTAMSGLKHRQETVASSPKLTADERSRLTQIGVPEGAYGSTAASESSPSKTASIRMVDPKGNIRLVPPDKVEAAKAAGGRMADQQDAQNYAYGGMVQPMSTRMPKMPTVAAPHVMVPHYDRPAIRTAHFAHGGEACYACGGPVRSYDQGGQVPGQPIVNHDSFKNDTVPAKLTPGEMVLPLHVTRAKDPALAAYAFMRQQNKVK